MVKDLNRHFSKENVQMTNKPMRGGLTSLAIREMQTKAIMTQLVKNPPAFGWEDPLEKGKATYSSILDWRIPWTV